MYCHKDTTTVITAKRNFNTGNSLRLLRVAAIVQVLMFAAPLAAQDVLPFPTPPMGGKVGPTMQESVNKWRAAPRRLPEDAPNILIVMLDDAGYGQAAPAELKFWINGKETAGGTVQRTVPGTFTASETFDVGMDTCSPVADAYFDKAPFAFEGTLRQLHFKNLRDERPAYKRSPDDD